MSKEKKLVVGVLALQGAFAKHIEAIQTLGAEAREVRIPADLEGCDGLIIPGGESTVILRHLEEASFKEKIVAFAQRKPLFGTCAGLIIMSDEVTVSKLAPLHLMHISVERNAYGRQVESFKTQIVLSIENQKKKEIPALFIRAPRIRKWDPDVKVLARIDDEPVLVQEGHHLASTFHPELTPDLTIHRYFLELVRNS